MDKPAIGLLSSCFSAAGRNTSINNLGLDVATSKKQPSAGLAFYGSVVS